MVLRFKRAIQRWWNDGRQAVQENPDALGYFVTDATESASCPDTVPENIMELPYA